MAIMRQLEGQMQCNNFNLKTAFLIGPVSPKMSTYYSDHQLLPNIASFSNCCINANGYTCLLQDYQGPYYSLHSVITTISLLLRIL